MKRRRPSLQLTALLATTLTLTAAGAIAQDEVNLYSYRQPFLIEPMLEAFTSETGIKVNTVFASKGMVEKIKAAGANNPADLVLTVDVGRLDALASEGLLQPVRSEILEASVPASLRHPDGLWFALTTRARVVYAHRGRVKPGEVKTLADLADPRFRGRICSRSGKHVYNVALIASVIANEGAEKAEQWLRGVKANLARKPQGNDRAQAKAIHEGVCDLAIANSYYMGKMASNEKKPEQKAWARDIRMVFLDQEGRGQHVNISGAALVKNNRPDDAAIKLLEFLVSDRAQQMYASINFEYPVKAGVKTDPYMESLGRFKPDSLNVQAIADNRKAATQLVDVVGFDLGP
jgi:iron(III) transport system substrate-binding protein